MVKDTAVLNGGDKESTSSQNVKVKVTKNVTESSVTIVNLIIIILNIRNPVISQFSEIFPLILNAINCVIFYKQSDAF